jgi:hypothetical protein
MQSGPRVANDTPAAAALYVARLHTILWGQITLSILLVCPFTGSNVLQRFATDQVWVGGLAPMILLFIFACIPGARNQYPGYWVSMPISNLSEAFALAMTAGVSRTPVFLIALTIVWMVVGLFVLHGWYVARTLRLRQDACTEMITMRGRGQWGSGRGGWSPALLMLIGWGGSLACMFVMLNPWVVYPECLDGLVIGSDAAVFRISVSRADVLIATLVAVVFLFNTIAETYWSTMWFTSGEYVVGSFSLFVGIFSLLQVIVWLGTSYVQVVRQFGDRPVGRP